MPLVLDPSLLTSRDSGRPVCWWVGIDGGGTSTRAVVADASGQLLGRGESGASALNQGVDQAWRHIREAIERAGVPGLQLADCALGLGLSGTGVPAQLQGFLAADPGVARLALVTDGFAGLLGAHGGRPGGLLISGTGSVAEALRVARAERPDLVILDLTLPDGQGLSIIPELLVEENPPIFVALTGHDTKEVAERCRTAGCASVLVKPVTSKELLATVDPLLASRG